MNPTVVVLLGLAAFAAASPQWGHGPVADTPEVAAAKAAHFAAVARASGPQPGAWNGAPAQNWNGAWNGAPAQNWNGGHQDDDGQWRDDTHLYDQGNQVAPQQWNGGWNGAQEDDGQWRDDSHLYDNGNGNQWAAQGQWSGNQAGGHGQWAGQAPQWAAQPQHLVNGDTPEVAAARAAHLAAHAAASSHRYKRGIHAIAPVATLHSAAVVHTPLVHSSIVHSPIVHSPIVHAPIVHHAPLATVHGIW